MQQSLVLGLVGALGFSFGGCSSSTGEVFTETQQALAEGIGDPCVGEAVGAGEVVVEENADDCQGAQICVSVGTDVEGVSPTDGTCSCRCDGPAGSGPFCLCGDGLECRPLVDDLGLENVRLTGSYCTESAEAP